MEPRRSFQKEPPAELLELSDRVRGLLECMLVVDEGDPEFRDDLLAAARTVRDAERAIAKHARPGREVWLGDGTDRATARPYYVKGPGVEAHNPVFPVLDLQHADGVTTGTVTFGVVHEGPPGCVHGGIVAVLFDQVMGYHNVTAGVPGMTGTLSVRYRRPTPLLTELRFEARTGRASGRKITTLGSLWVGEELVCEAEGLFIQPRQAFHAYMQGVQGEGKA